MLAAAEGAKPRSAGPLTARTAALRITGTGATATLGAAFTPRSLRTAPLAITGTGSL